MAVDGHSQRQRIQTGPATGRAGHLAHVALKLLPLTVGLGVLMPASEIGHHALEVGRVDP